MSAQGFAKLAESVGWDRAAVSSCVVTAFNKRVAPRYEQCDLLSKVLGSYQQFNRGVISFQEWLVKRAKPRAREHRLLAAEFAQKLQNTDTIRNRILSLAEKGGGEVTLAELRGDSALQALVADRYGQYLADCMGSLVQQGIFIRVKRGRYRLAEPSSGLAGSVWSLEPKQD